MKTFKAGQLAFFCLFVNQHLFKFGLVVFIDRYITLHLMIKLIGVIQPIKPSPSTSCIKKESPNNRMIIKTPSYVGMTGFEPATTRPPDAYSNRAELHPATFL